MANPHFWVVLAMFAVGVVLHYPQQLLGTASDSLFSFLGLSRHSIERVFLLLPVTYCGLAFRITGGLASLVVALAIMLPRAILISANQPDALLETGGIIVMGGLVNLWFEGYRREQGRCQQALLKLEAVRKELQAQVQAMRNSQRRLAALDEISHTVSHSLELRDILNAAVTKVREVMDLEVALVFLLNEKTQRLELDAYQGVSPEFAAGVDGLKVGEGFNGRVAQTGEPLLVENASSDSRLTREVVKKEGIQAQLIVPMKAQAKVVGTFSVATRRSRRFPPEDIEMLSHIANHMGAAVQNARLYQQQRLMAEQEKQMQERLRYYIKEITRAQEEERRRIAQELHDDTTQELITLLRQMDDLIATSEHLSPQDAARQEKLLEQASKIVDGVRRSSQDLRPSLLDDLGLMPALEWLTSDVTNHLGVSVELSVQGAVRRLPPETESVLFRIIQEALRNVWKHAEASQAWVSVEFSDTKAVFTVRDNGRGFEVPERIEDLALMGKLGLTGMWERAELIGAKLSLESEPGKGTTVTAEIPL